MIMIETELKMILKTFNDLYYFKKKCGITIGNKIIIDLINLALHLINVYKSHEMLENKIIDGEYYITKTIYDVYNIYSEVSYTKLNIKIAEIESFIIALNENDTQKFIEFLELKFS